MPIDVSDIEAYDIYRMMENIWIISRLFVSLCPKKTESW